MKSKLKNTTRHKIEKNVTALSPEMKKPFFPRWLRNLVLFIYELSLFGVLAVAIALLVVISKGKFFSADGLILSLLLVLFFLLYYARTKIEKHN